LSTADCEGRAIVGFRVAPFPRGGSHKPAKRAAQDRQFPADA